jgi:hypothetical protein
MDINWVILIVQFIIAIVTLSSVIILYLTIKSNKQLNQNIIFNEVVKQERELRIKLSEYREEIDKRLEKSKEFKELSLDYNTILFNYYEYLAICLYKKLIGDKEAKLYFYAMVKNVKDLFDSSILFEENYAKKEDYPGIQWLFRKWDI